MRGQAGWGRGDMWGLGSVRDRGGGTSSPSPSAPPPRGDIPTVQYPGISRKKPGYGCSPDIATHGPRPQEGAGEERRRRGWGGAAGRRVWVSSCEGAGGAGGAGRSAWVAVGGGASKGCWREVRWLECGRQGKGNKFPLPVGLTPNGDIPTIQHMGRSRRETGHGSPLAPPRIRLLP